MSDVDKEVIEAVTTLRKTIDEFLYPIFKRALELIEKNNEEKKKNEHTKKLIQ